MQSWIRRHAAGMAFGASAAWSLLVVGAPLLASGSGGRPGMAVSALAYLAGSVVCHQQPARSFHVGAAQLPVCARCTGLYLAGCSGIGLALLASRRESRQGNSSDTNRSGEHQVRRGISWRAILIASAAPMLLSVALEWAGVWRGSNAWRAVTGLPAGWAVGALVVESLSFRGKL